MTVAELISSLQGIPGNTKVAIYSDIAEDSDMANTVTLLNKSEGPYNKGDDVWAIYNIPAEENILFVGNFWKGDGPESI